MHNRRAWAGRSWTQQKRAQLHMIVVVVAPTSVICPKLHMGPDVALQDSVLFESLVLGAAVVDPDLLS